MGSNRFDVYQHLTDQIVAMIESSRGEFKLPWHVPASSMRPKNVATQKPYRGINILALWASAELAGYASGLWGTYKQWTEANAQVRRGEKASYVLFYKEGNSRTDRGLEKESAPDIGGHSSSRWIARSTAVFAAEQVNGFELPAPSPVLWAPVDRAEEFVASIGATIVHGGHRAFYRPTTDCIHLPPPSSFVGTKTSTAMETYYSTLFHELTHWSGHESRCNRNLGRRFGAHAYAMEELIAELGASFLCADLGVTGNPRSDHGQYIAEWLTILCNDKKAIFAAASQASHAVDFLWGLERAKSPSKAACRLHDQAHESPLAIAQTC